MKECNCHSYNGDYGETGEVILTPPLAFGFTYPGTDEPIETICIDACIAEVIQSLWDSGIETLNSCCGHGKTEPSIVLKDRTSIEDANKVRSAIAKVDDRDFHLMCWDLRTIQKQ